MTTTKSHANIATNPGADVNGDVDSGRFAAGLATDTANMSAVNNNNFGNIESSKGGGGGGGGVSAHSQRDAASKRKKLKTRNAPSTSTYSKDHLDVWLENCLKDATNTQLSSSSEFLDFNPNTTTGRQVGTPKNLYAPQPTMMSTQQQQQSLQTQQHSLFSNNLSEPQQLRPNANAMWTNSQPPMSYGGAFSPGFPRGAPQFMKQSNVFGNRFSTMFPPSGNTGFYPTNDGSQDFASLPPIVNLMSGSSELEHNSTDVLDGSGGVGGQPNMGRGFRFSDPCLLNPSDNDSKASGQNTPDRRNAQAGDLENNKFFAALMEQINLLHETNSKICRNLHETKGAYTPGMMTDVVREVKEAARVREDALLNRVKSMVEERQWSTNEGHLRMLRDIEELKSQMHFLRVDRKEANKRILHLEAENKYMRKMLANLLQQQQQRPTPDIIYENEALRTRKSSHPPKHSRRSQSLNLHYGTLHRASSVEEEQDEGPLHITETPSTTSTAEIVSPKAAPTVERCRSCSSSSEDSVAALGVSGTSIPVNGSSGGAAHASQNFSPPTFALVSADDQTPSSEATNNVVDKQALRRELTDAVAARRDADERIIALEKLVKKLQFHVTSTTTTTTHPSSTPTPRTEAWTHQHHVTNGNGGSGGPNKNILSGTERNVATSTAATSMPLIFRWPEQSQTQTPPKLSLAGPITDL